MSRLARTINVIQKECQTHCHSKQLQLHPFPWFHFESALKPEDFCPTQFLPYALSTKAPVPAKRAAGNGGNPLLRHLDCLDWGMFRCFNTGCFIRCFSSMEAVTYDFSRLWSPKCEIFWWERCFLFLDTGLLRKAALNSLLGIGCRCQQQESQKSCSSWSEYFR